MERSEPALVPEWLRCSGSVANGSTSTHHSLSSSLNSDDSSFSVRSRSSRNSNDRDPQRPPFLDRSSSSNSRRAVGSNGSDKHPYSNFTRNHRDKNREKVKERSAIGELWDHDPSDLLDNILKNGVEKSSLRRSQSLAPRRTFDRRLEDSNSGVPGNHYTGNGVLLGASDLTGINKASFDKDFPFLGAEEKATGSGIVRVSSPVLTTAVQSLPLPLLGSEKWTSALAEVPATLSTNMMENTSAQPNVVPPQQGAIVSQSWVASNTVPGLNMAEALSQAPLRTRATPQVPDKNQRLDELAKKQSKQLIPVKPSVPKALVSVSLEKAKQPKGAVRATDLISSRSTQQQQQQQQQLPYSSHQVTQARGAQVKSDGQNTSHVGKFLVLKPSRENGTFSTVKDTSSPTNNSNDKVANGQAVLAPLSSTTLTTTNITKATTFEKKTAALTLHARLAEKKLSFSQAQSRSDFFNQMRKKTSINNDSSLSDSGVAVGISPSGKASEDNGEDNNVLVSPQVAEKCDRSPANGGNGHDLVQSIPSEEEQIMCLNGSAYPDEEEAAFLRSLGWEENGEDEGGLTEEEINAFYEEYMKLRPSLKAGKGIQVKCPPLLSESHSSNSVAASSDSYLGESEPEA